jgi:hypothetical protein
MFGNCPYNLVGALPNATLIGFTGTPIDKTAYGQGTFKVFGKVVRTTCHPRLKLPQLHLESFNLPLPIRNRRFARHRRMC